MLEQEIVPLFYDRRDGIPTGWIDRIKHNWATIGSVFTASRMVRDYTTTLYEPAAASADRLHAAGNEPAKALAAWKRRVRDGWNQLAVRSVETATGSGAPGEPRPITATIALGTLSVEDIAVEVVHGPIDADGNFVHPSAEPLVFTEGEGGSAVYRGSYQPTVAGRYGCSVRVLPHHADLATSMELGRITWAS